ncbi:MAG: S1C family serine protease [Candidatus Binataceae bacterium]
MNASVFLLDKVSASTVGVHAYVPETHVSASIGLGTDRRGTGTIVSADGLILTVYYLVMGAKNVMVTLPDGEQRDARIVAQDYRTGLALLKIDAAKLPYLTVTSSAACFLGQPVFIVTSLGGDQRCADCGLVSYLGPFDAVWEFLLERSVCIMTSAMNIGSSGGPICDTLGQVVAVSYLNFADISRSVLGIPGECFLGARDELVKHGRRVTAPKAWLGVLSYTLREHVVIAGVMPGGPGEKAGLKQGDVVLSVDGREISERRALYDALLAHQPGEQINFTVLRNSQVHKLAIPTVGADEYFS